MDYEVPPPDNRSFYTFQNLYRAYLNCRKNKRHTYHAAKFEMNCEKELLQLEAELADRTYLPGKSIHFVVTEPVIREIFAAAFRDRVVHHLLYNFLEPVFEPLFIPQSCACRKNKGTHYSLRYLTTYLRKITSNGRREAWFLHLDIRSFFMSMERKILFGLIQKRVARPEILWLSEKIIFNDIIHNFITKSSPELRALIPRQKSLFYAPENRGLPIGNLTSQFFANVYLHELDIFVKHTLKARYYLRYVDDFILLHEDRNILEDWERKITGFVKERLGLELNGHKRKLAPVSAGIDWIGYIVKPTHTLSRRRVAKNCRTKLHQVEMSLKNLDGKKIEDVDISRILSSVNSYFGHFKHADTFRLRKHLYEKHIPSLQKFAEPFDDRLISFTSISKKIRGEPK